jgi:cysteine synthase
VIRLARSRRLGSIVDAVGNTPLLRLAKIAPNAPDVELYLKLEFANPGGSVKDRPAKRMVEDAIADGRLTPDKILIDSTSGNTGVAYSLMGAALGFRVQLVMPKNVTKARKDITQAFGTELIFSDPMEGSDGAIRLVRKLVEAEPDKYFYPDQYSNPSNPLAHGTRAAGYSAAVACGTGSRAGGVGPLGRTGLHGFIVAATRHGLRLLRFSARDLSHPLSRPRFAAACCACAAAAA